MKQYAFFHSHFKRVILISSLILFGNVVHAQEETSSTIAISNKAIGLADVVKLTIANSPDLLLQTLNVESARAAEQIQTGFFDVNTNASISGLHQRKPSLGSLTGRSDQDLIVASAGLSKLFRTGVSANFSVDINRIDSVHTNSDPALDMAALAPIFNQSGVKFTLTIPFLKNGGTVSAGAGEKAAILQRQAAELSYQHFISSALLQSITTYWEYKAALDTLQNEQDGEQRVTEWYNKVEQALQRSGDEAKLRRQFKAQITLLDGFLADKKRRVSAASQAVNTSRIALAGALGIPLNQANAISGVLDKFPTQTWTEAAGQVSQAELQPLFLKQALEQRLDLAAAKLSHEASIVQQAKARKDLNPTLNLSLSAGYNGLEMGNDTEAYVDAFHTRVEGVDSAATLMFHYPIGNNVAQGQLALANAAYQRSLIQLNEQTRNIGLQLDSTLSRVFQRLEEAKQARNTVAAYGSTLGDLVAQVDLMQDPITVFKLTDSEEKFTEALIDYLQVVSELAKEVAQLRFQTGTLIVADGEVGEVTLQNITSLPQL